MVSSCQHIGIVSRTILRTPKDAGTSREISNIDLIWRGRVMHIVKLFTHGSSVPENKGRGVLIDVLPSFVCLSFFPFSAQASTQRCQHYQNKQPLLSCAWPTSSFLCLSLYLSLSLSLTHTPNFPTAPAFLLALACTLTTVSFAPSFTPRFDSDAKSSQLLDFVLER